MSTQTDLDLSVAQALASSRIVGKRNSYAADNPAESVNVFAYLKGGARPASVATAMGLHLVALEDARRGLAPAPTPTPTPPPTSTFPPSYAKFSDTFDPAPSSRWAWQYTGGASASSFPNAGAKVVSDDEGGKALRLTIPAGAGGNGILSACYEPSGQWGSNGYEQRGTTEFRLTPGFVVASGSYFWFVEWHENFSSPIADINSCALGIEPSMKLHVQLSGGDIHNHQYTQFVDSEVLQLNRWYHLDWHYIWSPDPTKGLAEFWLNGRQIGSWRRGTLQTDGTKVDTTVFGLYNYHLPAPVDTSIDFRRVAIG